MTFKSKQVKILEYFYMNSWLFHVKSNYSPTFKSKSKQAEQDRGWSTYKGQQSEIPKHREKKKSLLQDKKAPRKQISHFQCSHLL